MEALLVFETATKLSFSKRSIPSVVSTQITPRRSSYADNTLLLESPSAVVNSANLAILYAVETVTIGNPQGTVTCRHDGHRDLVRQLVLFYE